TTQPLARVVAGTALSPTIRVAYEDTYGNINTAATGAVTMSLGTNACSGATLGGPLMVAPTAGVASFGDLGLRKMGQGYKLAASGGGLSATSTPFDVYSWVAINNGLYGGSGNSVALDAQTPSTLYLGTYNGLYKSTDAAATWTQRDTDGFVNMT